MLRLNNVRSGYLKNHDVISGVSFEVAKGEVVAIVGQNGAGKSTLAKTIMGMLPFTSGEILLENSHLDGIAAHKISAMGVGYLMQGGQVFPHMTINENLRFAFGGSRKHYSNRLQEIEGYFDLFRSACGRRLNVPASHLSGGERHQLALAMVLIRNPKLLILDEPSAGLSPGNITSLYQLLETIRNSESITMILIEQNILKAVEFSSRVLLLRNGTIAKSEESNRLNRVIQMGDFIFN